VPTKVSFNAIATDTSSCVCMWVSVARTRIIAKEMSALNEIGAREERLQAIAHAGGKVYCGRRVIDMMSILCITGYIYHIPHVTDHPLMKGYREHEGGAALLSTCPAHNYLHFSPHH